jgi:hypothetical protein
VDLERLGAQLDEILNAASRTFSDRLLAFASAYVDFATHHPALLP